MPLRLMACFRSIRTRLAFLTFLAILPAAALFIYKDFENRTDQLAATRIESSQVTRLVSAQYIETRERVRQLLGAIVILEGGEDAEQCSRAMASLMTQYPEFLGLGVANLQGDVTCSGNGVPSASAPVNVADRVQFKRAIETGDFAEGGFQIGRVTGRASVGYAYPIKDPETGDVVAVVMASLNARLLDSVLARVTVPEGSIVTLFDRKGYVISRLPDPGTWVGQDLSGSELFGHIQATVTDGTFDSDGLDEVPRLYAYTTIGDADNPFYVTFGIPTSLAYAPANNALVRDILYLIVISLLASAVVWVIAELLIVRKLRQVVRASRRLASGESGARTNVTSGPEEITELAKSFNNMAEAIESRQAAERELRADLERRNADMEAFTYSVSHDLKEPLRAIEGFSQYLVANYEDDIDVRGKDLLSRIAGASARMKALIEDLLSLSRAGRDRSGGEVADAHQIVEEIFESIRAGQVHRDAQLTVGELPVVAGDRSRLEQVFSNLISNSLKYNQSERPSVDISVASVQGNFVTIAVRDNGIGIDPQYHERIFGLFQRLHTRDEYEGNGAGLAIVKRAVDSLSGSIRLDSAEGSGSTFFVSLPLARSTQLAA